MAVTLHWIARTTTGELELKTALGGFRFIKDKHSGENIAKRMFEILDDLKILDKVSHCNRKFFITDGINRLGV
jgi:hypothetical protein